MRNDEHIHYSDDDLFNPETHHETSDVNVRALLWFLAIFVIISVIAHFVLLGFYRGLSRMEKARTGEMLTQMQRPADAAIPKDEPLLQPFPHPVPEARTVPAPYSNTPVTDLVHMRRAEQQALESYGWVDQRRGIVRIPIAEAKRILVERGLPVQAQATATTTEGPR
jgi:hypothetical protein